MNKIGLHVGYWWGTGLENDYDELIRLTAGAGVDVIEITPGWILPLAKDGRKELAQKIAGAGLVATVNGGLTPENDISSDVASVRRYGIEYCKRVLEAIADIGADIWSGLNFSAWLRHGGEKKPQEDKKRALSFAVDSMRQIIGTAEDLGVNYCFEVVNRYEQFLFNTSRDAVAFAEAVGGENATILLDSYHMNIEEDDPAEAIRYAAQKGRLGHFHVGESNRRIPGTGPSHMDWPGLAAALRESGFTGALVMEPFVLTGAHNAHKTCTWRQMAPDVSLPALQADAKTGADYLRTLLK